MSETEYVLLVLGVAAALPLLWLLIGALASWGAGEPDDIERG